MAAARQAVRPRARRTPCFGGYGTSDPAMLLAVNPQQWRDSYLFHAQPSWQANYWYPGGLDLDVIPR